MKEIDHYWHKDSAMDNFSERVDLRRQGVGSMLGLRREKTTEVDRLDKPRWGRTFDTEQNRRPANQVNIRVEKK